MRQEIQRLPSGDRPPPVTIQWRGGMIQEVLPPGMENADHPHLGAEMFGVLGEFRERFGGRVKK